jgi:hypothetical protein
MEILKKLLEKTHLFYFILPCTKFRKFFSTILKTNMKIFYLLPRYFKWENSLVALNGVVDEVWQSFNTYYKVKVGMIPCGPTIQKFGWWLVWACEDVSGWMCLNEQWWANDKLNKQMKFGSVVFEGIFLWKKKSQ